MTRTLTAVGATLAVLLAAPLASAQAKGGLGQQGNFIVSADRLVPLFSFTNVSQEEPTADPNVSKVSNSNSVTSLSLLGGYAPAYSNDGTPLPFFTAPRVGFDYVIVPSVTLGGELIFFTTLGGHTSSETDFKNGTTMTNTSDAGNLLMFGIAPRGGYILELSDLFSLWLRGGVSFYTASYKTTEGNPNNQITRTASTNQFAIDLDPQFVITPMQHFGITVGPSVDIPIAGGHSTTTEMPGASSTVSNSSSIFYLGVTAGMLVWF
jgi:hypothetical protein